MEIATRFLRDPELARDIHQQTFLRLWAGAASFEGRARFSTWIHQVVVNLCRDCLRRESTRRQATSATDEEPQAQSAATPDVITGRRESARLVAEAVTALPDKEREVVMLKHYAGLTFRGTAEVLGIPVTTAKSRMGRALDRLRRNLEDLEP